MLQLRRHFNLSYVYQEIVVSATIVAAAIFSHASGPLNERLGRRPVIALASVLFALGSVIMGGALNLGSLICGRFVVGAGVGLASMTVPVYIAECSPSEIRGPLLVFYHLLITFGQVVAAVVDGIFHRDLVNGWRYMLGLGGLAALVQLLLMPLTYESPRWLAAHSRLSEAADVLRRIYPSEAAVRQLLAKMAKSHHSRPILDDQQQQQPPQEEVESSTATPSFATTDDTSVNQPLLPSNSEPEISADSKPCGSNLRRILADPYARRRLLAGCGLQLIQQLCGINTVMYYSASIISMAGIGSLQGATATGADSNSSQAVWLAAIVASVNCLASCLGLCLISRFSRRRLVLSSLAGVVLSLSLLGVTFQLIDARPLPVDLVEPVPFNLQGVDPKAVQMCATRSTCNTCISAHVCGFCYQLTSDRRVVNGSCLLSTALFSQTAAYGRCNSSLSSADDANHSPDLAIFTLDYCPSAHGWLAVLGLMLYLAFFAPGMGPLPWTINAELYPAWARNTGVAMATSANWLANLFVSLTFLSLTEWLTRPGVFWLYAAISLVGLIFLAFILPETRTLSLDEIQRTQPTPTLAQPSPIGPGWAGAGSAVALLFMQSVSAKKLVFIEYNFGIQDFNLEPSICDGNDIRLRI
ncbi:hypothetical protein SprV_0100237000 [Sparganum proliferum]